MEKKQIAVVGTGISGLLACKYTLAKGFHPIVFESEPDLGGVWSKTIQTTHLQAPKSLYQFSDFPWPPSVAADFPTQRQILDYLHSYADRFDLTKHIKFHSRVTGIRYQPPPSDEHVAGTCPLWNGTGEPFRPDAKWIVTVHDARTLSTEVYEVDFVILCLGRFKDVPNTPEFFPGRGPEAFRGTVVHSMEYAAMEDETAAEFVKGKRVAVVGFGKSGLDIARECSSVNGVERPCTIVYRNDHWKLPDWAPWGIPLPYFFLNRFAELTVHKPGEGFLLGLLATILSPLRWGVSKVVETYITTKFPLARFDMVPKHRLADDVQSCLITYMPNPEGFFDEVEKGSIRLVKSPSLGFYEGGILVGEDETEMEVDTVILATGFRGVEKLKGIFESPEFASCIEGSPDSRVPLYRECIHPRIPQLAIIGFSESLSNLYISEMRCKWLASLLEGAFKLPSIKEMEEDVANWDAYMKRSSGVHHQRSSIGGLEIWYNDQLCRDMGLNPKRKNGFWANLFEPYGPMDYTQP